MPHRTCCPHATVIFLVLDQRNVWRFVSSSDPCLRRLAIPAVKASDRLLGLVGENLAKGIRSTLSHPNGSGSRLCGPQGQRLPDGTGGGFAGRPDGLCRSSLHGDSVMSDARHAPGCPGASHASGDIPVNGPFEVPAVHALRCWPRPAVRPSPVLVFFNFTTRKQHDKDIIGCRYR